MVGEQRENRWVIHPWLWFDAVCLIPLLAGLPFYTSRHEHDAPRTDDDTGSGFIRSGHWARLMVWPG